MFIGPFADDHFTAGDRTLGPEGGVWVNYSASYPDGYGGSVSWQPLSGQVWAGAPTPVRMPVEAAARSVNRTVAMVLCTHVFVPAGGADSDGPTLDVVVTGSTSSLATVRVNNNIVANDRIVMGRTISEFTRPATLLRGR